MKKVLLVCALLYKHQLYQITRAVPDEALAELRAAPIWVKCKAPRHRCMCYHPSNHQEYFAECTETFFQTNDFYPFVRSELQQPDPHTYQLLKKLWKVE